MRLQKKFFFTYFIYSILISIYLLNLFNKYSYFNKSLITFCLSFYIIGYLMFYEFQKCRNFFSLNIIFNAFGILYTNFYIFQQILLDCQIDSVIFKAMNLSYISIIFFNLGYFLSKKETNTILKKDIKLYNKSTVNLLLTLLLIVSISVEYYVIFQKIGFSTYKASSRAAKSLLMSDYSVLSFYKSTIPLICISSLYLYFKYKNKYSRFLFTISFLISMVNSVITVSRAELISILLPILFLLNHYKKISNKIVVILGISSFVLFGAWKGLSYGSISEISFDSEFDTWYRICSNVLSSSNFSLLYGKSYLNTLISFVVPVSNSTSLSSWYVHNFEYSVFLRGGGRGFSGVLEAYMNFGILGNILVYYLYGWIIKQQNDKSDFSIILYMIFMISIFQFFRSESYSLWKNMVWFKLYPVILVFFISKKSVKKEKVKVE